MAISLRPLDYITGITILAHLVSVLLIELHLALPDCVKAYYPSPKILTPLKHYISSTGDCLAESLPVWGRFSAAFASAAAPALLYMLPAVLKGGRPSLRCPLMLLTACLAIVDAQLCLHYFATEKLCGSQSPSVDIRPALLFHGFRCFGCFATATNLLFQEAWGKRRSGGSSAGGSKENDSATTAVTTRSKAAAAKKKAK